VCARERTYHGDVEAGDVEDGDVEARQAVALCVTLNESRRAHLCVT